MEKTITETYIRNFFHNGHNLFAIVNEHNGIYYVQLGHKCGKYKRKENALKRYKEYLHNAKVGRMVMLEEIDEKDLKRFAVITYEDTIFWDSNDVLECEEIFRTWDGTKSFKGIYDYERSMYLDLVDIIDLVGVQIHNEEDNAEED